MIGINIKINLLRWFLSLILGISSAFAGNPPFFPTDLALGAGGELIMTQKGPKRVDVFAADGRTLLHSYPTDGTPTGLLADGDKAF
ncbi:MAG: YVTN family beta-propeller repeat-containing protein, partial [Bacteroidaceae bacterium]|nr:YVTN family beta-propeller repeat-containing protein [Bacteroidaceae bacterium]